MWIHYPPRRSRKELIISAQPLSPAFTEKSEDEIDVAAHGIEGAIGVVFLDRFENSRVLFDNLLDIGRIFIEVGQIFLDAHKEIIVEGTHQIDL